MDCRLAYTATNSTGWFLTNSGCPQPNCVYAKLANATLLWGSTRMLTTAFVAALHIHLLLCLFLMLGPLISAASVPAQLIHTEWKQKPTLEPSWLCLSFQSIIYKWTMAAIVSHMISWCFIRSEWQWGVTAGQGVENEQSLTLMNRPLYHLCPGRWGDKSRGEERLSEQAGEAEEWLSSYPECSPEARLPVSVWWILTAVNLLLSFSFLSCYLITCTWGGTTTLQQWRNEAEDWMTTARSSKR